MFDATVSWQLAQNNEKPTAQYAEGQRVGSAHSCSRRCPSNGQHLLIAAAPSVSKLHWLAVRMSHNSPPHPSSQLQVKDNIPLPGAHEPSEPQPEAGAEPSHVPHPSKTASPPHTPRQSAVQSLLELRSHTPQLSSCIFPFGVPLQSCQDSTRS